MQINSYLCTKFENIMENNTIELSLMEPDERELVQFILDAIPAEDSKGLTADNVLLVLDLMDDYLAEQGLLKEDETTGEAEYLDGEVDETEQMQYVAQACKEEGRNISLVQIQLIMDAELQFGIQKGYYEED